MELTKNEIEIIEILRIASKKNKNEDIVLRSKGDGIFKVYGLRWDRLDTKYKNAG